MAKRSAKKSGKVCETTVQLPEQLAEKAKAGDLRVVKHNTGERVVQKGPQPKVSPRELLQNRYLSLLQQSVETPTAGRLVTPETAQAERIQTEATADRPVITRFLEENKRVKRPVLSFRPADAPSILEEVQLPVHLIIFQHQSPGDILMLTAAIRDLHKSYPGMFVTAVRTAVPDLFHGNPYITHIDDNDPKAMWLAAEYSEAIRHSNGGPYHFIHAFRKDFEARLGLRIRPGDMKGDIHFLPVEYTWFSQIREIFEKDVPFWVIDAGCKQDYTNKLWERARFQQVVDAFPEITFVQIGGKGSPDAPHQHEALQGDNLINLVGQTSVRQLMRLIFHSAGVITPVSFPMHLAAAIPMHPRYKRMTRPCIVIAGGREPPTWEAYGTHQYLHTCGMLPCCTHGGCWKSRIVPIMDGDRKDYIGLCERPVKTESGQIIPECMSMITAEEVITTMRRYLDHFDYSADDPADWSVEECEEPEEVLQLKAQAEEKIPAVVQDELTALQQQKAAREGSTRSAAQKQRQEAIQQRIDELRAQEAKQDDSAEEGPEAPLPEDPPKLLPVRSRKVLPPRTSEEIAQDTALDLPVIPADSDIPKVTRTRKRRKTSQE